MKRRIITLLLFGGLVAGLCGCGGSSSGSSLPSEAVAEEDPISMETMETVIPDEPEVEKPDNECSAEDLVAMLDSESLSLEEIERRVAYGEISYEVYEELMEIMSDSEDPVTAQLEDTSESEKPTMDVDVANLMSSHVWEYETNDGYKIRETICLSPIFNESEESLSGMYALWESLGGSMEEIPSKDQLYEMSQYLRSMHNANGCNNIKYIIGTRTVENLTDEFPITADNPYVVGGAIILDKSYDNPDEDSYAKSNINLNTTTLVYYAGGRKCELPVSSGITLGAAKMVSDSWGPVRFIIVLPDKVAPNTPTGFAYDSLRYTIGYGVLYSTDSFTLSNWNG